MFVYTLDDVIMIILLAICVLPIIFLVIMIGICKVIDALFKNRKEK